MALLILLSDYFTINVHRVLRDFGRVLILTIIGTAGLLLSPGVPTGEMLSLGLRWGATMFVVLSGLLLISHTAGAFIVGVRLARSAGLPLNRYIKSDLYEQHGKAVLRVFLH
jgi:hypothetical protein